MIEIRLVAEFDGSPAEIFARVSDHESFFSGPGISCKVTRPGDSDHNGLGATREVRPVGLRFVEEITAWDAPTSFEYRVRECSLPSNHELGRLTFSARAGGTEVVWLTRYEIPMPLIGGLVTALSAHVFSSSFRRLLARAGGRVAA